MNETTAEEFRAMALKLGTGFYKGQLFTKGSDIDERKCHFLIDGKWYAHDITPVYKDDIDPLNVLAALLLGLVT